MYLSATAIKEWLDCPQKLEYRLKGKESKPNIYFVRGLIVHSIIADLNISTYEDAKIKFIEELSDNIRNLELEFPDNLDFVKVVKQVDTMLYNYYNVFNVYEPPIKYIEMEFNIVINGVEFGGRIDQIRGDSIYDWKTTTSKIDKLTLNTDYQFTLYGLAYKELYGQYPDNIYYGHLYSGELYKVNRTEDDYRYLKNIAKQIVFAVNNNIFPRAYDKYTCGYCPYKYLCFDENNSIRY